MADGIFIIDISPIEELTQEMLRKDVHLCNIEPKIRWINNTFYVSSSSNYNGDSDPNSIVVYYYQKQKSGCKKD